MNLKTYINDNKFEFISFCCLGLIILFLICFANFEGKKLSNRINELETELNYYKELNQQYDDVRDSLLYDIFQRDSILTIIKYNYEQRKLEIDNYNDSDIISQFEKLIRTK